MCELHWKPSCDAVLQNRFGSLCWIWGMLTFFLLLLEIFFSWFFQQLRFPPCVRSTSLRRQRKGVHPLFLYLVILGLLCLILEIWSQKGRLRLHFLDQNSEILNWRWVGGERSQQLWNSFDLLTIKQCLLRLHLDPFLEQDFFSRAIFHYHGFFQLLSSWFGICLIQIYNIW